jgi:hypothetical protein
MHSLSPSSDSSLYTRLQEILDFNKNLQGLMESPDKLTKETTVMVKKIFHSLELGAKPFIRHVHYHLIEAQLSDISCRIEKIQQSLQGSTTTTPPLIFTLKNLAILYLSGEGTQAKEIYNALSTDIQELLHANLEKILESKSCHIVGLAGFEGSSNMILNKDLALAVEMLLSPSFILSELSCMALADDHSNLLKIVNDLPSDIQNSIYVETYNQNLSDMKEAVRRGKELFQKEDGFTPKARSEGLSRASAFYWSKEKKIQEEIDRSLRSLQKAKNQQLLSSDDLKKIKDKEFTSCIKKIAKIALPYSSEKFYNHQDAKTLLSALLLQYPTLSMHSILFILDSSASINTTFASKESATQSVQTQTVFPVEAKDNPKIHLLSSLEVVQSPPQEHAHCIEQALEKIRMTESLLDENKYLHHASPLIVEILQQQYLKQRELLVQLQSELASRNIHKLVEYIEENTLVEIDAFVKQHESAMQATAHKELTLLKECIFSENKENIFEKIERLYPVDLQAKTFHENFTKDWQGTQEQKEELIAILMLMASTASKILTVLPSELQHLPEKARKICTSSLHAFSDSFLSFIDKEFLLKNPISTRLKKTDPLLSEIAQKYTVLDRYKERIKEFKNNI